MGSALNIVERISLLYGLTVGIPYSIGVLCEPPMWFVVVLGFTCASVAWVLDELIYGQGYRHG